MLLHQNRHMDNIDIRTISVTENTSRDRRVRLLHD